MDENILSLIRKIVKPMIKVQSFTAKIVSVDESNQYCTVKPDDSGPEVFKVRLTAVIADKKSMLLIIPSIGSDVIVSILNNNPNTAFIAQYSEIDRVYLKTEKIEVDCNDVKFNGGTNDGLVIIGKLVNKLNALERKHDALVAKFNSHTHDVPNALPAGSPPVTAVPTSNTSTDLIGIPTQQSELENSKIKH